jgi:fluoride exporter
VQKLLLIAVGGAVGTLARYGTGLLLAPLVERGGFPYATLAVNLLGCFLIGFGHACFGSRITVDPQYQLMLVTGFLGGFTTFSAYGWETTAMIHHGKYLRAGTYVLLSNVIGIALVLVGHALGRAPGA